MKPSNVSREMFSFGFGWFTFIDNVETYQTSFVDVMKAIEERTVFDGQDNMEITFTYINTHFRSICRSSSSICYTVSPF